MRVALTASRAGTAHAGPGRGGPGGGAGRRSARRRGGAPPRAATARRASAPPACTTGAPPPAPPAPRPRTPARRPSPAAGCGACGPTRPLAAHPAAAAQRSVSLQHSSASRTHTASRVPHLSSRTQRSVSHAHCALRVSPSQVRACAAHTPPSVRPGTPSALAIDLARLTASSRLRRGTRIGRAAGSSLRPRLAPPHDADAART